MEINDKAVLLSKLVGDPRKPEQDGKNFPWEDLIRALSLADGEHVLAAMKWLTTLQIKERTQMNPVEFSTVERLVKKLEIQCKKEGVSVYLSNAFKSACETITTISFSKDEEKNPPK